MRTQDPRAVRERIRQVKVELARLRMLERLSRLAQRHEPNHKGARHA